MNPRYGRLTGKKRSLAGFTQLWLGQDHLLLVNSSRVVERYQRFSFADIQAIVITAGPDRIILQILAVLASLGWAALAFAVNPTFGKWFFGMTGLLFLTLAVFDIARGPRCRCFLHTAVGRWPLLPVSRQRIARKFVAAIVPAIQSVQGTLQPDRFGGTAAAPAADTGGAAQAPEMPRPRSSVMHVLFPLFLLDAALFGAAFHWPQSGAGLYLPTVVFGELLLAVAALIQGRANPLRFTYVLIVLSIACAAVDILSTGRIVWAGFIDSALQRSGPPRLAELFAPGRNAALFASGWRIAASVSGMAAAYLERGRISPR